MSVMRPLEEENAKNERLRLPNSAKLKPNNDVMRYLLAGTATRVHYFSGIWHELRQVVIPLTETGQGVGNSNKPEFDISKSTEIIEPFKTSELEIINYQELSDIIINAKKSRY